MKTKVEMRPAHTWTCDECCRDNFERGVVAELSPEGSREMRDAGCEGNELKTGFWMTIPESVKCGHCGAEFETEEMNGSDEDKASRLNLAEWLTRTGNIQCPPSQAQSSRGGIDLFLSRRARSLTTPKRSRSGSDSIATLRIFFGRLTSVSKTR